MQKIKLFECDKQIAEVEMSKIRVSVANATKPPEDRQVVKIVINDGAVEMHVSAARPHLG